jgi:glycosyltransferase involved in cell wall biosynthesis
VLRSKLRSGDDTIGNQRVFCNIVQAAKPAKNQDSIGSGASDGASAGVAAEALIFPERFEPSSLAPLRLGVRSRLDDAGSRTEQHDQPTVSLTMIVRDEEENLSNCLESVRGVFDEIVIVDTGSTDRTIEIARSFGAKVFEFAWIDDFAAARNEALTHATGDYAFWLDADDVVEPLEREKLVALLDSLEGAAPSRSAPAPVVEFPGVREIPREGEAPTEPELDLPRAPGNARLTRRFALPESGLPRDSGNARLTRRFALPESGLTPVPATVAAHTEVRPPEDRRAAYVVRCACDPSPDGTGGDTVVDHIRLFPIRNDLRWTYRVHEQILPSLRRAGIPVKWTDLTVRHTGYVDKALRARKLDRDTKILWREKQERPDDPFILFNIGAIAVERERWGEALEYLTRSVTLSAPTDSIVRKLYALIARVHQMTGQTQEALRTCAEGLKLNPEDAELWFRKGVVHRYRGESTDAERCWRGILELKRPNKYCSFDQGIYGHLTRRNLAVLAAERGDRAEAETLWSDVLAECPGDRDALAKLDRIRTMMPKS